MTDKKPTLEEAEAHLEALEKPGHDVALANIALRRAESDGDTAVIKAALDKYTAAVQAKEAAGVTPRQLDIAGQAVLDARGEAHTETNILPSDHGLRTVLAGRALALAQGEGRSDVIAKAQADLDEAIAADDADKLAHVADSHERTLAASKGEV